MAKPLDGIRVFDITLAGVGPWAGKLLAYLGAEVIHVEAPGRVGEPGSEAAAESSAGIIYVSANNNKRSVMLDLKDKTDREAAYRLLGTCDVFLENMRPGAMERLGLGYEAVSEINPGIVYLAASGYGQTGPMVGRPGADSPLQAFGGWASITGYENEEPEFFRTFIHLDYNTSQYITQAILLGLYARLRTGRGQKIEVAMLAAAMSLQSTRFAEFFVTGKTPRRLGSAAGTTAPHEAFRCEDLQYLAVGVVQESEWPAFCHAIDRSELEQDERFATNALRVEHRAELSELLAVVFASRPLRWWEIQLTNGGVPNGRFQTWSDLRNDPQVLANHSMSVVEHPRHGTIYQDGVPWHFSKTSELDQLPSPQMGEYTEELLRKLRVGEGAVESAVPAGD